MWVPAHMCTYVERPEFNTGLFLYCSLPYFETVSLAAPASPSRDSYAASCPLPLDPLPHLCASLASFYKALVMMARPVINYSPVPKVSLL